MASKHDRLMQEHHLLLSKIYPNSRYFRRDVGLFYRRNGTPIQINMAGQADAYGLIKIKNLLIHVEFEYKIGNDIQSKDQKNWQSVIESLGGIYEIVHNTPQESIERLKARIKGLEECWNIS